MPRRIVFAILLMLMPLSSVAQTAAPKTGFNEHAVADFYLQYVPLTSQIGLGWTGLEHKHNTIDRTLLTGLGFVTEAVMVNGLKYTIREERPDGSARNSFPSGHTATAFLGAELVRMEYGWGWGVGAYAVAASVGALRVYHKHHFWWDTLAGASCGIASAHVGQLLLEPTRKLLRLDKLESKLGLEELSFSPTYDPITGAYGTQLSLRF